MRLPLLLLCLACGVVVSQDAPDYDYVDNTAADTQVQGVEGEVVAGDAPLEDPIVEVPENATTTTTPKTVRRRLIKAPKIPRRDPTQRRRTPAPRTPVTTEASTASEPATRGRGSGGGRNTRLRPSRRGGQTETKTEEPQEPQTATRGSRRRPGSRPTPSTSGSSPRRSSSRNAATTEAPDSTSHRFTRPRRPSRRNNNKENTDTATTTTAAPRRNRPRIKFRPVKRVNQRTTTAEPTTAEPTTTTTTTTPPPTTTTTTTTTPPPTTTTTTSTTPIPEFEDPLNDYFYDYLYYYDLDDNDTLTYQLPTITEPHTTISTTQPTTSPTKQPTTQPTSQPKTEQPTTPPPTTTTTATTTPTPTRAPNRRPDVPLRSTQPRATPRPVWIRTPAPESTEAPTTTPPPTTTRASRRGSSRYTTPAAPKHAVIEVVDQSAIERDIFAPPLSPAVKSSIITQAPIPATPRSETSTPQRTRVDPSRETATPQRTRIDSGTSTPQRTRIDPSQKRKPGTRISPEETRAPVTSPPTTTSEYPSPISTPYYGPANIQYSGGDVVITEVGTVEDTRIVEVRRILGGLGSRRRGLMRPQEQRVNKKAEPGRHKKPTIDYEQDYHDYYDDYQY